jgi:hypothetical protein
VLRGRDPCVRRDPRGVSPVFINDRMYIDGGARRYAFFLELQPRRCRRGYGRTSSVSCIPTPASRTRARTIT